MSRWLKNVGSILERLDDQAERVAEIKRLQNDDGDAFGSGRDALAGVLAARGLDAEQEVYDEENMETTEEEELSFHQGESSSPQAGSANQESVMTKDYADPITVQDADIGESLEQNSLIRKDAIPGSETSALILSSPAKDPPLNTNDSEVSQDELPAPSDEIKGPTVTRDQQRPMPQNLSHGSTISEQALSHAQKEARTLRKHVLTLNKQLELAEAEIQAQREELERAAERMEKDRSRQRQEREKEKNDRAEEIKTLKAEHEKSLKEQKDRFEHQFEEMGKKFKELEERRMQEGGDWNKELADAIQREQNMAQKYAMIQDERETLLSQISTLQVQQEALGSRLESLTQTAENATERERDAEDRLDEALSQHTRQLSQRHMREAELERTIQELGAALVNERNKRPLEVNDLSWENDSSNERVQSLEHDLENLRTQLDYERQRCEVLHRELADVSGERKEEAIVMNRRQAQYEQELADLMKTVTKLKSELTEAGRESGSQIDELENSDNNEANKRIKDLSEEILRQREKIAAGNNEITALKNRLKVALDRASKAEETIESFGASWDPMDVEIPPSSAESLRRRGYRKSKNSGDSSISIRSALHFDFPRGDSSDRIGKALDGLDAFLLESAKFMRFNPVARLLFILYLVMLHLWTFLLLMLHTHRFEDVHGDFGAGSTVAHGPHALMQNGPHPPLIPKNGN